ncbi:MAG TPA: hypothetical protein VHF89_09100, partial [Solirubrobacteraceae bacterium]|nr:hypothetical protein [Solirubrobacteraceae bacterium]
SRLAYADGAGVKVAAVPGFESGCSTDGATPTPPLVIAGGREPDFGPADVPPARPEHKQDDTIVPDHHDTVGPAAALTATASRAKLRTALVRGLKLTVTAPTAGRLAATARAGGRTVAKAPAKQVAAGAHTITLRFTKAARRALKRKASVRLAVKVTLDGQATTLAARLKR